MIILRHQKLPKGPSRTGINPSIQNRSDEDTSVNRKQTFRSIILEGGKKQHYGKDDKQRLLCDFTKESVINAGSVGKQTFRKCSDVKDIEVVCGGEGSSDGRKTRLAVIKVWEGIRLRRRVADRRGLPRVGCRGLRVAHQWDMGGSGDTLSGILGRSRYNTWRGWRCWNRNGKGGIVSRKCDEQKNV